MSQAVVSLVSISLTAFLIKYYPDVPHISVYAVLVGVLPLYLLHLLKTKNGDPYGLYHLSLNKIDGEEVPETEWLNVGYWKDECQYPKACKALARKLISASRLQPGEKVLDVGHGTGESLIFMLSDSLVSRPSNITGITKIKSHHERSLDRVTEFLAQHPATQTKVNLIHGDAVYNAKRHDRRTGQHPFSPFYNDAFDVILALDCAYHFNTRHQFLAQSFAKLAPGGRIALADVCFTQSNDKTLMVLSKLLGVPSDNLVDSETYIAQLKEIGYQDIQLEDISDDVFPRFIGFLRTRGLWWVIGVRVWEMLVDAGARCVIVSAEKGE